MDVRQLEMPVRLRLERPMSDDELLAFCSANDSLRVERESDGELLLMSPSGLETSFRNTRVVMQLARWADEDGRGLVSESNGGFRLPDGSVRSPDAAWLSWTKWDLLSARDQERYAPVCPEFVIELRSPTDRLAELQAKMAMWTSQGAELAWLVDPERRVVEVYRPGRPAEVLEGQSAAYGEGPVGGFVLELSRIWA